MPKLPSITENTRSYMILVLAGVLFLGVLAIDLSLPLGVAAGVSYVVVVLLGWWLDRNRYIFIFASIASLLTWVGYLYSPEGGIHWMVVNNRILSIFAIWNTAILLYLVKRSHAAEHDSLKSLQQEIANRIRIEVETSHDLIWSLDRDGRFTYLNPVWESTLGYDLPEMLGRRFTDFKDPIEASRTFEVYQQTLKRKSVTDFETIYLSKSGNEISLNFKGVPKYDFSGQICGTQGTAINITARKKAEEGLRESENHFRDIVEGSIQGIIIQRNGKALFVNHSFAEIFGYDSPDEILGMEKLDSLVAPQDRKRVRQYRIARLKKEEAPSRYESRGQKKDGTLIWLENLVRVVEWEGAQAIQATVFDVTERKLAENKLQENEKLLQTVFDTIPILVAVKDSDGRYLRVNKEWSDFHGISPEIAIGKYPTELPEKTEEIKQEIRNQDRKVLVERQALTEIDELHIARNGEERHIHTIKVPILSHIDEQPQGLVAIAMDITERKQAEEALRESEDRYARAMAGTNDGLWDWNIETNEAYTSQRFRQILGYEIGEFDFDFGRFTNSLHPDDADRVREAIQRHLEEGVLFNLEYRLLSNSGIYIWVQSRGQATWDKSGNPLLMAGSITDITERKQAEESLLLQEEIVKNMAGGVAMVRARDGNIIYASQKFEQLFGYETQELIGQHVRVLNGGSEQTAIEKNNEISRWLVEHRTWNGDILNAKKDGTEFWSSVSLTTFQHPEFGEVWVGVHEDATDRKQAEEALRDSRSMLQAILDTVPVGIFLKNLEGKFLMMNHTMAAIYDMDPNEVVGLTIKDMPYLTDQQKDFILEKDRRLFESDRAIMYTDFAMTLSGERQVFQRVVKTSFYDDTQEIIGQVGIVEDITERKQLEDQLRQSQKMEALGTLAGGIAHDFNNILTPILGYSEMMLKNAKAQSRELDYLKVIFQSAIRAKDLVSQILLFSRRGQSDKLISDLSSIVKEVGKFMRSTLPTAISVQQHISGDVAPVFCNPSQMHQMILNLCVNAGQAMTETGILRITLNTVELDGLKCIVGKTLSGNHVRLTVTDTGIGMDNETLSHIFDPFFTTKEIGEGTGLGLSTVFGIVQDHEGGINVFSEPGQGTTFQIHLPAVEQPMEKPIAVATMVPNGGESILFIDDEEAIAEMGKNMLEEYGYKVTISIDSRKALKMFKKNPNRFDVVVTDQGMPNLKGDQLAAKMRQARPDIPIILCTGHSNTMTPESSKAVGINAFLYKPVKMKEMGEVLRKVLDEAQQTDTP